MTVLDTLKQLTYFITDDRVVTVVGVLIFAAWLLRTSLGRQSLADSQPRRNSMAPYTPLIPFFVWFMGFALVNRVIDFFVPPAQEIWGDFLDNAVFGVAALLTIIGLIFPLARFHFARGLKGFGLRLRTIPRDLGAACVNLLAVWPLMAATLIATTIVARLLQGPDFEMPQHETLKTMTESSSVSLQTLLVFVVVVVAPLIEETMFRGMFQTMIRSYLGRPWLAIIATSVLFASVHKEFTHWPALFVLALGLGYAYEKSGSLFRPIFMHALFNGAAMAATLAE